MQSTTLYVEKNLYPAKTLLKAAYAFIDSWYIHFEESESKWIVHIYSKNGSDIKKQEIEKQFENELISQAVRLTVYQQTKSIREMLLARAMASAMVVEELPDKQVVHEESDISEEELAVILTSWFDRNE